MSYLTHLEYEPGGERVSADVPRNNGGGRGVLQLARYDLARIKREVTPQDIARGRSSLWRYAPLLPAADPGRAVTLGEGFTPLIRCERLARVIGCRNLWVKDEGRNPSGTFKDRGAAVAATRYRELGVETVALNSSGNAGGSWALYSARAGIKCVSILPTDAQASSRAHCSAAGARTYFLDNWHISGKLVAEACARHGWFDICTLKEPYRMEGKKTMGLEIAEQLGWQLPDVIVYPMGGGLGAIAIWKAFAELAELGWVAGKMPRLIVTQYAGCAPTVKAFDEGKDDVEPWKEIDIPPGGLKSPNPPGGRAVLALIRRHGGAAVAVSTEEALREVGRLAQEEGIFACPESATTLAGLAKALDRGLAKPDERIVIVCTGSGLKSIPSLPEAPMKLIESSADIAAD
jgi:threonine synthase